MNTLKFPDYPVGRPNWFCNRFLPYALRMGVAMEHGPEGMLLLTIVVLTEHKVFYKKSVRFWNDQLQAYLGCSYDRMNNVRRGLVRTGWLRYKSGRTGVSGIYWVTVPGGDDQIDDSVLGDNFETLQKIESAHNGFNSNSKQTQSKFNSEPSCQDTYSSTLPDEWAAAVLEVRKSGVIKAESATSVCREHGLRPSDVFDLVAWWRDNQEGFQRPPGALYQALTSARPLSDSGLTGDLGSYFPPLDPAYVQRVADRQRSQREEQNRRQMAKQEEKLVESQNQLKQLELDFGAQLDAMSDDDVLSMCPTPEFRSLVKRFTKSSPLVRGELLKLLSEQAG